MAVSKQVIIVFKESPVLFSFSQMFFFIRKVPSGWFTFFCHQNFLANEDNKIPMSVKLKPQTSTSQAVYLGKKKS